MLLHPLAVMLLCTAIGAILPLTPPAPSSARNVGFEGIEQAHVPLVARAISRTHALPETLPEFTSTESRTVAFQALVKALAVADWNKAIQLAKSPLKYQLEAIRDGNSWFVVASDDSGSGRDPTVVINTAPRRDVIFEAPHAPFEVGTAEQAVILLRDLGGVAALVSRAHRCASKSFTSCDGKTGVCGGSQPYRDSDPSHNIRTLFHAAHLALTDQWKKAIVVSLHGMKEDEQGVRTSVIISDGIKAPDESASRAATKLRLLLQNAAPAGAIVSCNLPVDESYGFRKLCGYTNIQGRNVNGDPDECQLSVDQGNGRFIHIEQDSSVLKPYAQNWSRLDVHEYAKGLYEAFETVVPAAHSPLPVSNREIIRVLTSLERPMRFSSNSLSH